MLGDYALAQAYGQAALDDQHARGMRMASRLRSRCWATWRCSVGTSPKLTCSIPTRPDAYASWAVRPVVNLQQLGLVACELGDVAHARGIIVELEDHRSRPATAVVLAWALHLSGLVAAGDGDGTGAARSWSRRWRCSGRRATSRGL